jgi:hypothetical protein
VNDLKLILRKAIEAYDFPSVTYDFANETQVVHPDMSSVEQLIRSQLRSDNSDIVKDGLSNVVYWGWAWIPLQTRVKKFRDNVAYDSLFIASILFAKSNDFTVLDIINLGLPQFSNMSFVSKVQMFLDPNSFVVLDSKIASLRNLVSNPALALLRPDKAAI